MNNDEADDGEYENFVKLKDMMSVLFDVRWIVAAMTDDDMIVNEHAVGCSNDEMERVCIDDDDRNDEESESKHSIVGWK